MTTHVEAPRAIGYGAVAAVIGAACMTVVRSAARRAGLIQKTVPQVLEERLTEHTRWRGQEGGLHGLADQAAHLGYGASLGAAYGGLVGTRPGLASGTALGAATWVLGAMIVLPVSGATRPPWRRSAVENGVDLLAHMVFGVATELVRQDLLAQSSSGTSPERRRAATAG